MRPQSPTAFAVSYRICPIAPHAHRFRVEMHLPAAPRSVLRLSLPAWIPGSYMIRDFARNILGIEARAADGQAVVLEKLDKQTWQCTRGADQALSLSYEVFAWDLSVRAAHLDQRHGYFNGTSVFLQVQTHAAQPCQVELLPPPHPDGAAWRVETAMPPISVDEQGFGRYWAESYADLIDHPVEMGEQRRLDFVVAGVPHAIAISGRHWLDETRLTNDLRRVCEQQVALFGELPVDRYLFLLQAVGEGYGGLEHAFSSSLMMSRADLAVAGDEPANPGYRRLLGLCSHEYCHLWLVKRIRPAAFIDPDLSTEVHTRLLWAFEGITSYYDDLALVRSGCVDTKTYLGMLAETLTRVWRTPGRLQQTLAESSFDAWTKFYKQDENAPNAIVSYYAKGALVALALDLTIRRDTDGQASLDTVMRALWQQYGRIGRGVPERGIEALASAVTGLDLETFFAQALDSTMDLDLAPLLATVGIAMRWRPSRGAQDLGGCVDSFADSPARATLAVRLRPGSPDAVVGSVIAGGAGEQAGVAPGDRLLAVDGLRVTSDTLETLVERAAAAGEAFSLHLFRGDELLTLTVPVVSAVADTCELCLAEPTPEPCAGARAAWLGCQD